MRILILRSCRLPQFYQTLNYLEEKFPNCKCSVLAQNEVYTELKANLQLEEVILYPASTFSPQNLSAELLTQLTSKKFDLVVIIYSNISGLGFKNVHNFAQKLNLPVYIYDKAGNFYQYSSLVKIRQAWQNIFHQVIWEPIVARKIKSIRKKIASADTKLDSALGGESRYLNIKTLREGFAALSQGVDILSRKSVYRPLASIIIVNFNGRHLLEECLPSVYHSIEFSGGRHEVIVVDNGSSDGSQDYLQKEFPSLKLIALLKNEGFSKACNLGARQASYNILVFLNNDLVIKPDFLSSILSHFEQSEVFAVSGRALVYGTENLNQGQTIGVMRQGGLEIKNQEAEGVVPTLYVMGGGCAIDRKKYERLQGFDEIFSPGYWEDVDICLRAWRRGWKSLYDSEAVLYHKVGATAAKIMTPKELQILWTKNRFLFLWKNLLEADLEEHWKYLPSKIAERLMEKDDTLYQALNRAKEFLPLIIARRRSEKLESLFSFKEILADVAKSER